MKTTAFAWMERDGRYTPITSSEECAQLVTGFPTR